MFPYMKISFKHSITLSIVAYFFFFFFLLKSLLLFPLFSFWKKMFLYCKECSDYLLIFVYMTAFILQSIGFKRADDEDYKRSSEFGISTSNAGW